MRSYDRLHAAENIEIQTHHTHPTFMMDTIRFLCCQPSDLRPRARFYFWSVVFFLILKNPLELVC